jgi:hypothetical protein
MTATVTVPPQPGIRAGTYVFAELEGTPLGDFVDPRGAFVQSRVRVTRADLPGFRVEFVRLRDRSWASVEFYLGQTGVTAVNLSNGYSVAVSGDSSGSGSTPAHWWGARWRLSGGRGAGTLKPGRNGWPVTPVPYARLVSERLIPDFDPAQNGSANGISAASPRRAATYTPMGGSGLTTTMGETGGRADIGLFNDWDSHYLASLTSAASAALRLQAPELLASMLAINEAAASIPWYILDARHGCLYERLVNNPAGGNLQFNPAISSGSMQVLINGPAGMVSYPQGAYLSDSAVKGVWWLPRTVTIPASGNVAVTLSCGPRLGPRPVGAPKYVGGSPPANVTYAWGDAATYAAGSPWAIDTAHCPEVGYVAYLLFRDPWDLMTVQANAMFAATNYPEFGLYQVRQAAWDYRSAVCAWVASPDNGPAWLLPRATMDRWVNVIQLWILANVIRHQASGHPELATVFHEMEAGNARIGNPQHDCHGNPSMGPGNMDFPWQNAYFGQAASFALIVRPDDKARIIATYVLTGIDDRYNGTSGWPNTLLTPYHRKTADTPDGRVYRSLSQAWAANAPLLLTMKFNGNCELTSLPSALAVPANRSDYPNNDFAALSLGVQAGLPQFRASRDYVGAACKKGGFIEDARAFRQV